MCCGGNTRRFPFSFPTQTACPLSTVVSAFRHERKNTTEPRLVCSTNALPLFPPLHDTIHPFDAQLGQIPATPAIVCVDTLSPAGWAWVATVACGGGTRVGPDSLLDAISSQESATRAEIRPAWSQRVHTMLPTMQLRAHRGLARWHYHPRPLNRELKFTIPCHVMT